MKQQEGSARSLFAAWLLIWTFGHLQIVVNQAFILSRTFCLNKLLHTGQQFFPLLSFLIKSTLQYKIKVK